MKPLSEGIKVTQKQKQQVLSRSDEYNVGIEYEFHNYGSGTMDVPESLSDLYDFINANDIGGIDAESTYETALADYLTADDEFAIKDARGLGVILDVTLELPMLVNETLTINSDQDDMFGGSDDLDNYIVFYDENIRSQYENDEDAVSVIKQLSGYNVDKLERLIRLVDLHYEGDFLDWKYGTELTNYAELLRLFILAHENNEYSKNLIKSAYNLPKSFGFKKIDDLNWTLPDTFANDTIGTLEEYIKFSNDGGDITDITSLVVMSLKSEIEYYLENDASEGIVSVDELASFGVNTSRIDNIVEEHGGMSEVITNQMSVTTAIDNMEEMFSYISTHGYTSDSSGLHISISTNKHDLDNFNIVKYVSILDIPELLNLFPERAHVQSLEDIIMASVGEGLQDAISDEYNPSSPMSLQNIVKSIIKDIERDIDTEKYQSIKFGDYKISDGRIELRFFGGEGYENRKDAIVDEMLKALYLLDFAYSDEHNKTYYKRLTKLINKVCKEKFDLTLSQVTDFFNRFEKMFGVSPKDMNEKLEVYEVFYDSEDDTIVKYKQFVKSNPSYQNLESLYRYMD